MPGNAPFPKYSELPFNQTLQLHYAWGVFGDDDQLGRLNLLTPEVVLAARDEIRRGVVFALSLPLNLPARPPYDKDGAPGRKTYRHTIFKLGRRGQDDYLDGFYLQGSTQWDSLRHIRAREFGYYNGIGTEAEEGGSKLGIEHFARHGIVGRGVLADVGRWAASQGRPLSPTEDTPIMPDDLAATLRSENVELRPGDILMVRTGYLESYLAMSRDEQLAHLDRPDQPGLYAGREMAEFLWDSGAAAVVADNLAVENVPGSTEVGSLHRALIPLLGFAIGEYFDLAALARDCAEDGKYTSLFTAAPLNLPGGVGSPGNALAIK
jgi:kynurenine formamidase